MLWLAINLSSLVKLFWPKLDCCTVFSVVAKYFYFFRELGESEQKVQNSNTRKKAKKLCLELPKLWKGRLGVPNGSKSPICVWTYFEKKLFDHENEEPGPLRKKKKLPKWALLAESNCNWMKVVIACCVANPSFFLFHIWNLHSEKGGEGDHIHSPPTLCPNLHPPTPVSDEKCQLHSCFSFFCVRNFLWNMSNMPSPNFFSSPK